MNDGTFNLTLKVRNDDTAEDIAERLRSILPTLDDGIHGGAIRDDNGNTIGEFGVKLDNPGPNANAAWLDAAARADKADKAEYDKAFEEATDDERDAFFDEHVKFIAVKF